MVEIATSSQIDEETLKLRLTRIKPSSVKDSRSFGADDDDRNGAHISFFPQFLPFGQHAIQQAPTSRIRNLRSTMRNTTIFLSKFVGTISLGLLTVNHLSRQRNYRHRNELTHFPGRFLYRLHRGGPTSLSRIRRISRPSNISANPSSHLAAPETSVDRRNILFSSCIHPLPASIPPPVFVMVSTDSRSRILA